jgi:hypothetical protein
MIAVSITYVDAVATDFRARPGPPGTKRGGPLEAQTESRRWGYSATAHW